MGMGFNFSSMLGMGRVTGKYVRIGYGDGEGKTRLPPPLPCLAARVIPFAQVLEVSFATTQPHT